MKYMLCLLLMCQAWSIKTAEAKVVSKSQELVVLQPQDLPESAQSPGQSMELHSLSNGGTYLYVEQQMGKRLAIFDVTDPGHIKSIGSAALDSPSIFDFVRDLDESTALICFRNNKGAAIVDFRRAKEPSIFVADALQQAGHAESIGFTGLLMVAAPRRDGDVPVFDYQVVDASDPRRPKLLITVAQVKQKLTDRTTGATYLLGADGLTVIRQPRLEQEREGELTTN